MSFDSAPKRRWRLEISAALPNMLTAAVEQVSSRWRFYEEGESVYFEADELESLADARHVLEQAQDALLGTINGYFYTVHPNWRPLFVRGISRAEPDRPSTQFVMPLPIEPTSMVFEPTVLKGGELPPKARDMAFLLNDPDLARVLRLFSAQPLDWAGMYRVYEAVRATDKRLLDEQVTESDRDRFRRTANSPAAVGDRARHGKQSGAPPSDPMSESEARGMIARLVEAYRKKRQPPVVY